MIVKINLKKRMKIFFTGKSFKFIRRILKIKEFFIFNFYNIRIRINEDLQFINFYIKNFIRKDHNTIFSYVLLFITNNKYNSLENYFFSSFANAFPLRIGDYIH